ncbi:MAG: Bax inhibitor-1/YccA family protein [Chloroflexota bacterium]|nr:Bax inhibitor-1/YccA family protein [Chloroflexota bacterium]
MSVQVQPVPRARTTLVGQVLSLLAFSMVFTTGGAFVAPVLGASALSIGGLGALATFAVLFFWQRLQPVLRLAVFYLYSVFQGITLGTVIRSYVAAGQADVVVLAAGTTAGLTLALAVYAWTTRREIAGWAPYLFMGLIGVLIAAIVGLFVRAPLFHLVVSAATAIVFSGYLLFHVQQIKSGRGDPIGLAISIYIDILNVFWSLLRILSELTRRRS